MFRDPAAEAPDEKLATSLFNQDGGVIVREIFFEKSLDLCNAALARKPNVLRQGRCRAEKNKQK